MSPKPWVLLAALALLPASAAADDRWTAEVYGGSAYNFRSRLHISQDGGYSQSVSADYRTRGLTTPPYYVLRAGRWQGEAAWEASLIHHKLYLANPPAGTQSVSISHGFNILSVNRAFRAGDWTYRFGIGGVVTHAEATINGIGYDGPFKLAGAAALAAAGRRFYVGERTFVSAEAMITAAYANPRLPGTPSARLETANLALHFLLGLGHDF